MGWFSVIDGLQRPVAVAVPGTVDSALCCSLAAVWVLGAIGRRRHLAQFRAVFPLIFPDSF